MTATETEILDLGRLAVITESYANEENQLVAAVVATEEAPPLTSPGQSWTIPSAGTEVVVCAARPDADGAGLIDHLASTLGASARPGDINTIDPAAGSVIAINDATGPAFVAFLTATPATIPTEDRRVITPTDDGLLSLGMLREVPLDVSAELGHARLSVAEILQLNVGSVIELDRTAGAPVDVVVNGSLIARGEVVVIDDEYGVRITEIVGRVDDAI